MQASALSYNVCCSVAFSMLCFFPEYFPSCQCDIDDMLEDDLSVIKTKKTWKIIFSFCAVKYC